MVLSNIDRELAREFQAAGLFFYSFIHTKDERITITEVTL